MELFGVEDSHASEYWVVHLGSPKRGGQLFGGENGAKVLRINTGIVVTSLFKIDVPSSSQGVRFGAETSGTEADDHVKGGEVLRPASLSACQKFHGAKVFQVLVTGDDIHRRRSSFEVMSPGPKSFKNGQEFFVVDIVI